MPKEISWFCQFLRSPWNQKDRMSMLIYVIFFQFQFINYLCKNKSTLKFKSAFLLNIHFFDISKKKVKIYRFKYIQNYNYQI
jgi:hypothetical protein